jgi:hypothetical protein
MACTPIWYCLPKRVDFARSGSKPGHFAESGAGRHTPISMFGWGDRDFYLNTPTWTDMNPLRSLGALVGRGRTVVHVSHIPKPRTRAAICGK